jgi:hypothetical protein
MYRVSIKERGGVPGVIHTYMGYTCGFSDCVILLYLGMCMLPTCTLLCSEITYLARETETAAPFGMSF